MPECVETLVQDGGATVVRAVAPSATTTIGAYCAWKLTLHVGADALQSENGNSGIRITFAPPAVPAVHRDPAGVPTHHLDDQRAVMRLGGGVQPVDGLQWRC